jgi:hypothetical protein
MNKDIEPTNDKGQRHGYWEIYHDDDLMYKCFYQNDKLVGYDETYYSFCENEKIYHL